MDSAKNTLRSIMQAAQRVKDAIAQYSSTTGFMQVGNHSLVQLESDFQTIINASRTILGVLDDQVLHSYYSRDDRLAHWSSSRESRNCLDTLQKMERLLNLDDVPQALPGFAPKMSVYDKDDIHRAVVLFRTHDAYFDFFLATPIS